MNSSFLASAEALMRISQFGVSKIHSTRRNTYLYIRYYQHATQCQGLDETSGNLRGSPYAIVGAHKNPYWPFDQRLIGMSQEGTVKLR